MIGEGSGIVPDRGLNILYRVTMNTLMNLTDAGLTRDNYGANTRSTANTRLSVDTPKGILAGQMVTVGTTAGTVVASTGSNLDATVLVGKPIGVAINNAVGYPYESSSGVASGKCPYLHGTGTVITTDLYETFAVDGTTAISYSGGNLLYCSGNGFFTNVSDSVGYIVGVVLIAPTSTDPFMAIQLYI
jgi:hypothetical protein